MRTLGGNRDGLVAAANASTAAGALGELKWGTRAEAYAGSRARRNWLDPSTSCKRLRK